MAQNIQEMDEIRRNYISATIQIYCPVKTAGILSICNFKGLHRLYGSYKKWSLLT